VGIVFVAAACLSCLGGCGGDKKSGQEIIKQYRGSPPLDAGLLAAAQAVEHYEISRYGTLIAWADELGLQASIRLLKQTLSEEENTDKSLTALAESVVNQEAYADAAE